MIGTLRVGGITPFTTIDYPGELAAVLFCQGCPWRCRYCHNGHLLEADDTTLIDWSAVTGFLERRRGLLDAVVFSGGEPTAQRALADAIRSVRAMGFKVGLHSAGCYPERLGAVLPLVDWVGLDIKAAVPDYPALTGVQGSGERAWQSLRWLQASGVEHEVRVTVPGRLLPAERLDQLIDELNHAGVAEVTLQRCRTEQVLDAELAGDPPTWAGPARLRISTAGPGAPWRDAN